MDERFTHLLSEDEKKAIEILEDYKWIFLGDLSIEKAVTEGEKWPTYRLGGHYPMGMIRLPFSTVASFSPPKTKKKSGKRKKG